MKKHTVHIIWVAVAIVAFGGGFLWGRVSVPARTAGFAGARGLGGGRNGAGGGFVAGTIEANDGTSLTVQLPNGNSENVFYSSSTQIIKPSPAVTSDLKPGTMVMVGGTTNSDGSVTAQSIQIRNTSSTPRG